MDMLLFIVWSTVSCSIIFGYIYYVKETLRKIYDDETLPFETRRDRAKAKQQEIADIGTCMALPFIGILIGGCCGAIAIVIAS